MYLKTTELCNTYLGLPLRMTPCALLTFTGFSVNVKMSISNFKLKKSKLSDQIQTV